MDPNPEEYAASFVDMHARLKQDWPEAPEQLHSGGWDMTHKAVGELAERWSRKGERAGWLAG